MDVDTPTLPADQKDEEVRGETTVITGVDPAPPVTPAELVAPAAPPALPVLHMNDVPLKDLANRMIRSADSKFQELVRTLPSATPAERQKQLLLYAATQREAFEKLLVLTRFARKAKDWQQVMNVHGLIDRRTDCLIRAGHDLRAMVAQLRARVETSAPDVMAAIDVFGNKTYTQLPRILKDALPAKPPTPSETKTILNALDKLIRRRVELEIVPDAMRKYMVIEKGCVTFRVDNTFQLALTLVGDDYNLPWRIVELEFFVQSAESYKGLFSGLLGHQKYAILQQAQVLLEQVQKRNPRGPGATSKKPTQQGAPAPSSATFPEQKTAHTSNIDAKRPLVTDGALSDSAPTRPKLKKRKTGDIGSTMDLTENVKGKSTVTNDEKPVARDKPAARDKLRKKIKKEKGKQPLTIDQPAPAGESSHITAATAPELSQTTSPQITSPEITSPVPPQTTKKARPKVHNPYPILYVYEYLQKLLLHVQLEILTAQAHSLARDRWQNHLKVEEVKGQELLRLTYWSHQIPGPDPRTVPAGYRIPHRHHVLELSIKVDPPQSNRAFERWKASRNGTRGYLKHQNADHVSAKLFGDLVRPRRRLDIRGYSVIPDLKGNKQIIPLLNPHTGERVPLALDPSKLDLGALLTNITDLQSRFVLHRIRNLLVGQPPSHGMEAVRIASNVKVTVEPQAGENTLKPLQAAFRWETPARSTISAAATRPPPHALAAPSGSGNTSKAFREGDVQLHEWAPSGNPAEAMQAQLCVTLHDGALATVKVNTWTGRILLIPPGSSPAQTPQPTRSLPINVLLEQRLNDHVHDAPEILLYMRYSSYIEKIATWCGRLGLKASTTSPLKAEEGRKVTGVKLQNKIFVRIPGFTEAWIIIAAAGSEDWEDTGSTTDLPGVRGSQKPAEQGGDTVFRIWLIETSFEGQSIRRYGRAKREMNREIQRVTPISVEDVFAGAEAGQYKGTQPRESGRDDAMDIDSEIRLRRSFDWDYLDMATIAAVERMCRLQYAYDKVTAGIRQQKIDYCYLSPDGSTATYPDELDGTESTIAGREPKLCIPREHLAAALGTHDGDDSTRFVFGDLYLSIEHTQLAGHDTGDGSIASEKITVGTPAPVRGVHVVAVCGVRFGLARDMLVQRDKASEHWMYKHATKALYFTFEGVDVLEQCCKIAVDQLSAIATIGELAQQAAANQSRLAKIGVRLDPFDLQSLSMTFSETLRIQLWVAPDGNDLVVETRDAPDDQTKPGYKYCAVFTSIAPGEGPRQIPVDMVDRIKGFWEKRLNETGDLPRSLLVLWHMSPLLRLVHDLERKRNVGVYTSSGSEGPFVAVTFHSLTHVQLVYAGQYGVEFALLPSGQFGFYDSTLLPGRNTALNGPLLFPALSLQQQRLRHSQRPNPAIGLGSIPLFNGLIKGISKAALNPSLPIGTAAVPISFGVLFDLPLLDYVVSKMDTHLNNVGLLLWVEAEAANRLPIPQGQAKNALVDLPNMRATIRSDAREVVMRVSAANTWEFAISPRGTPEEAVTEELLKGLADLVAEKLNALPPGTDLRPFLLFFLEFLAMPTKIVTNLVCLARDERRLRGMQDETIGVEWCLAIPPDAPVYIRPIGAPATLFEADKNRISMMFRITNTLTSQSVLLPLRYNFGTDVIGRWQGPNADDLTAIPEMNPFMMQWMHSVYQDDTFTGLMAKVITNSADEVLKISKLATLLRIAAKKCKVSGVGWVKL
ncbi:mediator complex subunit MED14-domain-containing protein [Powellomyces hirtus]|nr:mediator complex subunit MED14-domain-containing protein [Powellomyces hirtus]